LLTERESLYVTWDDRKTEVDQACDLHVFLRDARQVDSLYSSQEVGYVRQIKQERCFDLIMHHDYKFVKSLTSVFGVSARAVYLVDAVLRNKCVLVWYGLQSQTSLWNLLYEACISYLPDKHYKLYKHLSAG
jgi:hypothetical protein